MDRRDSGIRDQEIFRQIAQGLFAPGAPAAWVLAARMRPTKRSLDEHRRACLDRIAVAALDEKRRALLRRWAIAHPLSG